MTLPNKTDVQTLKFAHGAGVACFVEASSSVDTRTLAYARDFGPFLGAETAGTTFNQTLLAASLGNATLARVLQLTRTFLATSEVTAVISTLMVISQALLATVAGVATLSSQAQKFLAAVVSLTGVFSLSSAGSAIRSSSPVIGSVVKRIGKILFAR